MWAHLLPGCSVLTACFLCVVFAYWMANKDFHHCLLGTFPPPISSSSLLTMLNRYWLFHCNPEILFWITEEICILDCYFFMVSFKFYILNTNAFQQCFYLWADAIQWIVQSKQPALSLDTEMSGKFMFLLYFYVPYRWLQSFNWRYARFNGASGRHVYVLLLFMDVTNIFNRCCVHFPQNWKWMDHRVHVYLVRLATGLLQNLLGYVSYFIVSYWNTLILV